MSLEDIVSVTITSNTVTPTRPGFGTGLLAANKVPTAAFTGTLVRSYGSLTEMTDDGFAVTDPAYKAATKYWSQNPRPSKLKVGKRANKTVQTVELLVTTPAIGDVFSVKVNGTLCSFTAVDTSAANVATALELLIEAVTDISSATVGATISITHASGAGNLFDVSDWTKNLQLFDATADPGIAADLAAINTEDFDWYGLLLDSSSQAEVEAAAGWVEANGPKLYVARSSDYGCKNPSEDDDVMSNLQEAGQARTGVFFHGKQLLSYIDAGVMGNRFPFDPGSDTWAFKTIRNVGVDDSLTSGQITAILNKNGNVYARVAGVNITEFGKVAAGEYFDVVRFIDWLHAEIQIRVFALLVNAQKVPYTDPGVDSILSVIKSALSDGVRRGGLAADPAPDATAPLVADISTLEKAERHLPDVKFTGTLAGAIHTLSISGTLSV